MRGALRKQPTMEKLVRDKIPQIIMPEHQTRYAFVQIPEEQAMYWLKKKLQEEVDEFNADESIAELADILEVVIAIASTKGYALEELEAERVAKAQRNGKFTKRILMRTLQ